MVSWVVPDESKISPMVFWVSLQVWAFPVSSLITPLEFQTLSVASRMASGWSKLWLRVDKVGFMISRMTPEMVLYVSKVSSVAFWVDLVGPRWYWMTLAWSKTSLMTRKTSLLGTTVV